MARSCGIRLGPRRYEVVVLDGSPKRHRITAFKSAEFGADEDDPVGAAVRSVRAALKEVNAPRENIGLVIDSGHAAFRHQTLPFSDPAKIDQVLKFEVESKLPQWNIDDVIVDYVVVDGTSTSSELLVTAVPKEDLRAALDILEDAGAEPIEAELETTAMVNAAHAAEICSAEDAQLLVHIGDHSTSVVVMDGGRVREMRVIHIGALTHDVPGAEDSEPAEEGAEPRALAPKPEVDPIEAARRIDQATKRIRRELGRTLSGARTAHAIESIYVCGMELPGLVGSSVLDVPVYILDCFEEDGGQPADGFGELVVAYGSAYRQLGGGELRPSLRREELRYAGAWERIEFPLAVACLILVTLLGVFFLLQQRKIGFQERNGFGYWLRGSNVYMTGQGSAGRLYPVPEEIEALVQAYPADGSAAPGISAQEMLRRTRKMLFDKVKELEKDLGQDASIEQPQSAFVGSQLVMGVLEAHQKDWRPAIHKLGAVTEEGKANRPEQVKVTMDVVFFADNTGKARQNFEAFMNELGTKPWLIEAPDKGTTPLENDQGVMVQGLTVSVDARWYYEQLRKQAEAKIN